MAIRSIATLSLTFGLVSIPVKVYLATESSAAIRFRLMASSGARVRQQYVAADAPTSEGGPRDTEERDEAAIEPARPPERGGVASPLQATSSGS